MNLKFDTSLAEGYKNPSQIARVLTEDWMARNMFCPVCGAPVLGHYEANKPVADFFCDDCKSDFELEYLESLPEYKMINLNFQRAFTDTFLGRVMVEGRE